MVKIQNGCNPAFLVSASAVFLAAVFLGSGNVADASMDHVLTGLPPSDLNNLLLNMEDYPLPDYSINQAPEYDNGYGDEAAAKRSDYFDYDAPLSMENSKVVEQRSDVTRADVPKHAANLASQQKAAAASAHSPTSPAVSAVLPAYCDPPNPCPLGYTAADGCIEGFENTSEFSRRYQSTQNCICDTEHMFNCPSQPSTGDADEGQGSSPSFKEAIRAANEEGLLASMENPYLTGEKLRVAAKKGLGY
jgi:hypothetical protein